MADPTPAGGGGDAARGGAASGSSRSHLRRRGGKHGYNYTSKRRSPTGPGAFVKSSRGATTFAANVHTFFFRCNTGCKHGKTWFTNNSPEGLDEDKVGRKAGLYDGIRFALAL